MRKITVARIYLVSAIIVFAYCEGRSCDTGERSLRLRDMNVKELRNALIERSRLAMDGVLQTKADRAGFLKASEAQVCRNLRRVLEVRRALRLDWSSDMAFAFCRLGLRSPRSMARFATALAHRAMSRKSVRFDELLKATIVQPDDLKIGFNPVDIRVKCLAWRQCYRSRYRVKSENLRVEVKVSGKMSALYTPTKAWRVGSRIEFQGVEFDVDLVNKYGPVVFYVYDLKRLLGVYYLTGSDYVGANERAKVVNRRVVLMAACGDSLDLELRIAK